MMVEDPIAVAPARYRREDIFCPTDRCCTRLIRTFVIYTLTILTTALVSSGATVGTLYALHKKNLI